MDEYIFCITSIIMIRMLGYVYDYDKQRSDNSLISLFHEGLMHHMEAVVQPCIQFASPRGPSPFPAIKKR